MDGSKEYTLDSSSGGFERAIVETLGALAATSCTPFALVRAAYDSTYRQTVPERFGRGAWEFALKSDLVSKVWLHGASVGEIEGLTPVARRIHEEFSAQPMLITTTSSTGQQAAAQKKLAADLRILPFDHPWILSRIFRHLNVRLFVQFETEIWPNLLLALQSRNVPVVIVNGRISDYSYPRYLLAKRFFKPLLSSVSQCLVQSEIDGARYESLGVRPERIHVVGSTKYDSSARPDESVISAFSKELALQGGSQVVTFGSVRPGEEEAVRDVARRLLEKFPLVTVIVAPRHSERYDVVSNLLLQTGFHVHRRSAGPAPAGTRIVFMDTMGELKQAYAISTVAFVGGTLVPIGGHNVMEPAMFGVPVVCGTHTNNVRDAVLQLERVHALSKVADAAELYSAIEGYLSDEKRHAAAAQSAKRAFESNLGATDSALEFLRPYLS